MSNKLKESGRTSRTITTVHRTRTQYRTAQYSTVQ